MPHAEAGHQQPLSKGLTAKSTANDQRIILSRCKDPKGCFFFRWDIGIVISVLIGFAGHNLPADWHLLNSCKTASIGKSAVLLAACNWGTLELSSQWKINEQSPNKKRFAVGKKDVWSLVQGFWWSTQHKEHLVNVHWEPLPKLLPPGNATVDQTFRKQKPNQNPHKCISYIIYVHIIYIYISSTNSFLFSKIFFCWGSFLDPRDTSSNGSESLATSRSVYRKPHPKHSKTDVKPLVIGRYFRWLVILNFNHLFKPFVQIWVLSCCSQFNGKNRWQKHPEFSPEASPGSGGSGTKTASCSTSGDATSLGPTESEAPEGCCVPGELWVILEGRLWPIFFGKRSVHLWVIFCGKSMK